MNTLIFVPLVLGLLLVGNLCLLIIIHGVSDYVRSIEKKKNGVKYGTEKYNIDYTFDYKNE